MKKLLQFIPLLIISTFLTSCLVSGRQDVSSEDSSSEDVSSIDDSSETPVDMNCNINPSRFNNVQEYRSPEAFISTISNNDPDDVGVIISPYFTMVVNEVEVPVYAARATNGIHSFAYVEAYNGCFGNFCFYRLLG